jgi:hypothetical protein
MKAPERKYNLLFLLVVSIIGLILVGLAYSGYLFVIPIYLLDQLFTNISIPLEISGPVCVGLFWGIFVGVPTLLLLRRFFRNRPRKNERQEAFEDFLNAQKHRHER